MLCRAQGLMVVTDLQNNLHTTETMLEFRVDYLLFEQSTLPREKRKIVQRR